MKKFIIERELPGAGQLSALELQALAKKSCKVIENLEEPYHWIQTFVTKDKLYCIHIAPDRETVLEHSKLGGFPFDNIEEVRATIDPSTANGEL